MGVSRKVCNPNPPHPFFRQEKGSTKIDFLGPETAAWGGDLPREGVGVGKLVPSLEGLLSLGFESLGVFKKFCAKRNCAHFSFPNLLSIVL